MHSSHETADPRLVAALTAEAPDAIARLERFGVAFTHDADGALPAGALRRRDAQAPAAGRRPHRARDRDRAARGGRRGRRASRRSTTRRCEALDADAVGLAGDARAARGRQPRRRGRRDRARGRRALLRRGQAARHVLDQRRRRDRRGDRDRARGRLRGARPRRPAVPPERRPLAGRRCRGTRSPRRRAPTARVLLNADGERFVDELGGRDVVAAAIVRECEEGRGLTTPEGRPSVLLDCRPIAVADAEISLPYMLRRYRAAGHRPARRADPHLSRAALPERRPRDRRARRDDRRRPLRRGRDRRRRARAQPHDGQLAARRLGLRLACGARGRRLGRPSGRSPTSPGYQSRAGILGCDEHRRAPSTASSTSPRGRPSRARSASRTSWTRASRPRRSRA